jgi:hypothetical protein
MLRVEFEPMIPVFDQSRPLEGATTVIARFYFFPLQ